MRTALTVALTLAMPTMAFAQQAPAAQDSLIRRGDRTIYHQSAKAEQAWGYAQAIVVGNTIYVSGTVSGGKTLDEEVANIYRRIDRTLKANGFTLRDVVKETVYTKDIEAFSASNPARLKAYAGHTPAATWVQVSRLLEGSVHAEIEVMAVRSAPAR